MQQPAAPAGAQRVPAVHQPPLGALAAPLGPTSTCTICGCDLSGHRLFHIRYRVCPEHATADVVLNKGVPSRFCQQCGRFHPSEAFEPSLRSCRQQLARHAARRRERRRQAAAAKAGARPEGEPAAAAPQQPADGQQKRRRQQQVQQAPQPLQQQVQAAAAGAVPTQPAGQAGQLPAAPASKRRRAASEGSALSSHEAAADGGVGTAFGSGGSSGAQGPEPAALANNVPLLTAVPARLAAPAANLAAAAAAAAPTPAWALQAMGLPLAAPQQAAPDWQAPAAAAQPAQDTSARTAEAAMLLAALMREPALASLLSPPQQPTPRQLSDPATLPSEAADGAALCEDAGSGPQQPATWEAASWPLRSAAAPAPQLATSPPPPHTLTQSPAVLPPGMQHPSAAPAPPPILSPPCLPLVAAPAAGLAPSQPPLGSVVVGLQRAAAQELIARVQLAQRDFDVECLLLRLAAMSPADCEAQLAQLLAGVPFM